MYDDLYLDVTCLFGEINILDERWTIDAYKNGEFSKTELDGIYSTKDRLIEEIKNHSNKCMNVDYLKYLENM